MNLFWHQGMESEESTSLFVVKSGFIPPVEGFDHERIKIES